MTLKNILIAFVLIIILANIIALNALPDAIIGFNLIAIVAILLVVSYFFWRRNQQK